MNRRHLISLIAMCGVALAGGVFLFVEYKTDSIGTASSDDQARYAEIPPVTASTTTPTPQNTASTTEKLKLPILVYHIVRPSYSTDSAAVKALAHTPEVFDEQMKYLGDAGYHIVSFSDLEKYYRSGTQLPKKPVIISFDDGWGDQYQYAFPILEKYHYSATFFVFTNPIGTKGFITWDQLREMQKAGMTIGSHSRSHPYLTRISNPTSLWNEIEGSKQRLEKELGVIISEFAYPFGQYNPDIVAMVQKAGYVSARGDRYYRGEQTVSRLFDLEAINTPTTLAAFEQKFP